MMRALWMTQDMVNQIVADAHQERPNEACGLIVGKGERATQVIPVANIHTEPMHYFRMDPAALAQHLPSLERQGLSLLGFYHSHPNGDPIPSETDIREATYHDTAYVIASLKDGVPRLAAWLINNGRVQPLTLHIGETALHDSADAVPMSKAQRYALVLAVAIVFVVFVAAAIYLLPPAPILP